MHVDLINNTMNDKILGIFFSCFDKNLPLEQKTNHGLTKGVGFDVGSNPFGADACKNVDIRLVCMPTRLLPIPIEFKNQIKKCKQKKIHSTIYH